MYSKYTRAPTFQNLQQQPPSSTLVGFCVFCSCRSSLRLAYSSVFFVFFFYSSSLRLTHSWAFSVFFFLPQKPPSSTLMGLHDAIRSTPYRSRLSAALLAGRFYFFSLHDAPLEALAIAVGSACYCSRLRAALLAGRFYTRPNIDAKVTD